jgi:hypothetical protein
VTRRPILRAAVGVLAAAAGLGGCALGPRPTLTDEPRLDDSAIDAVLDRLDGADAATFTATYTIAPTLNGSAPADVTVRHSPARSRITFATGGTVTVEYSNTDGEQRTCADGLAECVAGVDDSRVSNLGITNSFWGPSSAQRLTTDAGRNIADATARTETIAGQPATCATVPLAGGSVAYCALDAGPLASYTGADVTIELVSYDASIDQALLG